MDRQRRNNNRRQARQVNSPFTAKKGKGVKTALIITGIVLAVCGIAVAAVMLGWLKIPGITPQQTQPVDTAPVETQPDTVIHFVAGGDLNVTDRTVAAGKTDGGYDYSDVFLDVMPVLSGSDLTAINFEGNLCGEPYGSQYASAPQQMMQALRDAGVDLIQTANSHSVDNGLLGLTATLNSIRNAGMEALGTFASTTEAEKTGGYIIREVQGIRIAIVGFTKGWPSRGLPADGEKCVNLLYTDYSSTFQKVDEEGITRILRAAQTQKPDITIAMLHWGSEFNDQMSSTQKKLGQLMRDEGVDAVIGTHPRYVQEMGLEEDSGFFMARSLGDFFGDATDPGTDYSVLVDLQITKNGATGETKITGFDYIPIYICYEESGTRILRIREAMTAFENNSLGCVTQETYDAMASALARIETRVPGD